MSEQMNMQKVVSLLNDYKDAIEVWGKERNIKHIENFGQHTDVIKAISFLDNEIKSKTDKVSKIREYVEKRIKYNTDFPPQVRLDAKCELLLLLKEIDSLEDK